MKPIEAGCQAITYGCLMPANNNKVVKVIAFVGESKPFTGRDLWVTDLYAYTTKGSLTNLIRERRLMRIDDPDIQKQIEGETPILVTEAMK